MKKIFKIYIIIGILIVIISFGFVLGNPGSEEGLIIFWDNDTIPSGWTCISCTPGDPFFERFLIGNSTYGTTGGSKNHTHQSSGTSGAPSDTIKFSSDYGFGETASSQSHTHSISSDTNRSDNIPLYKTLKLIKFNGGVPSTLPKGSIAIFNTTSLPENWTAYSEFDGYYVMGNDTINSTGGSNTHTHTFSGTTSSSDFAPRPAGTGTIAEGAHTHNTSTQNLSTENHEPPFITVILAKINASGQMPTGIITMFNTTPPSGWKMISNQGEDFYEKFVKVNSSTYGTTGGSKNHSHSNLTDIVTEAPNTVNDVDSVPAAAFFGSGSHTHTFPTISFNDSSNLPPYTTIIFALAIDLTYPKISIVSPTNNTNTTNISLDITYTYIETNPDSCWWNDGNGANTTLASCGTNITVPTWNEGKHNVTIFINDTMKNENSSSVSFLIDTTSPIITIGHPEAKTYGTNTSLSLNYTISDAGSGVDSCWYNIYNSTKDEVIANTTIASCVNTTFNLFGGDIDYNLTLYSNDSVNNINSSVIEFGIRLDAPSVVLDVPSDDSYLDNGTNVYLNFTATDVNGLDTCKLWHNNTGTWHKNYTWVGPTSGTMNYTTANLTENDFIWNVWCNDTTSKSDWAINNFTLTIDETTPSVNIITGNDTTTAGLSIIIDYNTSDTNIDTCYFTLRTSGGILHNYPENTSLDCSLTSRSISTLVYGTFNIQMWGEDKAGNLGDANLTFTTITSTSGSGGGGDVTVTEEEEEKTFCGDGICQAEGNDYGVKEDFWNCPTDCKGFDLDILIWSFTKYCWDKDPSTVCFFQTLFAAVPAGEGIITKNDTTYKDGQVCYQGICEKLSGKTLFSNCFKKGLPCFWASNAAFLFLFSMGALAIGLSFVKIKSPGKTKKISPYKYVFIKLKGRRRKKWRR